MTILSVFMSTVNMLIVYCGHKCGQKSLSLNFLVFCMSICYIVDYYFSYRKCTLKYWMNILNYCKYLGHSMYVQYFIISLYLSSLTVYLNGTYQRKAGKCTYLCTSNLKLDYIEKCIVLYPKCTTVDIFFCRRLFWHTSINYSHDRQPSFFIFLILIVFN